MNRDNGKTYSYDDVARAVNAGADLEVYFSYEIGIRWIAGL